MLNGSDRVKLTRTMTIRVCNMGEVLFTQGTIHPYFYLVRRGRLTVIVQNEPVTVIDAGTAFGEISVLFSEPRSCTVVASSVCELYALHTQDLLRRLERFPDLTHKLVCTSLTRRTK
uniref:cAMP-dependent protein kinase regulatory subunit n=1 Tax=Lygus hesperus TaxID=30085 RepID=A0A0A9WC52_LYGHE